jgi:hypothetical protein
MHSNIANLRACRVEMELFCKRTKGEVGTFRQAYDVEVRLTLHRDLAAAVRASGVPAGNKGRGTTAAHLQSLRQVSIESQ